MKARIIFLVGLFLYVYPIQAEDPVYIPDAKLKAAIESPPPQGIGIDDPTPSEMLNLVSLTCQQTWATRGSGISDLTGLEFALNLGYLNLRLNNISSLSPISALYNLTHVDVSQQSQGISSISPLQNLTNITYLDIHGNSISDLTPLNGLTNLTTLYIKQSGISNLTPLIGKTNLYRLDCYYNNISNVSPLSTCTNLAHLRLDSNNISNISALGTLTNLQSLKLKDNNISNISALRSLMNLTGLDLCNNPLGESAYNEDLHVIYINMNKSGLLYDINPRTPKNVNASEGIYKDFVLITWDSVSHGPNYSTYYRVSRSTSSQGEMLPVSGWNTRRSYEDYTCEPGIVYFYCVQTATSSSGANKGSYSKSDGGWCDGTARVCSLTVSSTAGGSVVQPGEGVIEGISSQSLHVEAMSWDPNLFVFDHWTGTTVDASMVDINQTTMDITLTGDATLRAHFITTSHTLHVDSSDSSDGMEHYVTGLGTAECPFNSIQAAIEVAGDGATIKVGSGTYYETIDLLGKSIQLAGMDPNQDDYPVIDANRTGPVVWCTSGEDANCVISGFILTRGKDDLAGAVYCNTGNPTLSNCIISGNLTSNPDGAALYFCDSSAKLSDCTIVHNAGGATGAGIRLCNSNIQMSGCILWGNTSEQIQRDTESVLTIQYSDIQDYSSGTVGLWGGGPGIIDEDPLFAQPGYWTTTPGDAPIWIPGDYHLQSQAGRWDTRTRTWVVDDQTSPCIDAGNPLSIVQYEPVPNGDTMNIGAYAGTPRASKTLLFDESTYLP